MSNIEKTLADAGVDVSTIPEKQRAVLMGLSDDEVSTFTSIKARLEAASTDDVLAHDNTVGGTFW